MRSTRRQMIGGAAAGAAAMLMPGISWAQAATRKRGWYTDS